MSAHIEATNIYIYIIVIFFSKMEGTPQIIVSQVKSIYLFFSS